MWSLEPGTIFLNHGSFGACPRAVLDEQSRLRERMEAQPVRFFMREVPPLLEAARAELGRFIGADADDLAFVPNATTAVNAIVRSLPLRAGDEIVTTNHAYNACVNALRVTPATVVVADVPFPIASPDQVVDAILARVTSKTRLALIDHVTSPTAIVFPVERIIRTLAERGVDTMVDGAHALGMLPLDLRALGAAYYTANAHKWLCCPKGAAFLHVRRDRQQQIRPATISHGANAALEGRTRFRVEFDWTGTDDPTPALCIPAAIRTLSAQDGWPARNHVLALEARDILCHALRLKPPAPDAMLGSMASVPLPDADYAPCPSPVGTDAFQMELIRRYAIEVPIFGWPAWPKRLLRVSAQLYNRRAQYETLAEALRTLLT
jgi:isopenicillin-N epimerase